MKTWHTDGSPLTDTRLPRWFRWLYCSNAPEWLMPLAYWVARHAGR